MRRRTQMFWGKMKLSMLSLLVLVILAASCGPAQTPTPEVIKETVVVEQPVKETVVAEIEVTKVVERVVTPTPAMEQELVIALHPLPPTLTGNLANSMKDDAVITLLYEPLLMYNEVEAELVPVLAESWELIDGDTWRFHLRKGVRFHNGEPFDARSVKASFDLFMDPEAGSGNLSKFSELAEVKIVDDYTVDFPMDPPVGPFLYGFDRAYMLPPEYLDEVGPVQFTDAPVGTGPYKFIEWEANSFVVLERNEEYWGPQPSIKTVEFVERAEAGVRLAALEAGEVDIAYLIPPEEVPPLLAKGFDVYSGYLSGVFTVWLNPNKAPELTDQRVRQAILHAIDNEGLWKSIAGGYGRLCQCQMGGPDAFGYNPDLEWYAYDPEKARQLLTEAGYPDGFTLKFEATMGRTFRDQELVQAVAAQLGEVGIDVEVEFLESGVWIDKLIAGELGPLWNIGMTYAGRDPGQQLGTRLLWPEKNKSGEYDDQTFKDMWWDTQTTLDREARGQKIQELHAYVCEQAYGLFLLQLPALHGLSPQVQGMEFRNDYTLDLLDVTVAK
jgi:peptide/nickel transport system substrate-binding protein